MTTARTMTGTTWMENGILVEAGIPNVDDAEAGIQNAAEWLQQEAVSSGIIADESVEEIRRWNATQGMLEPTGAGLVGKMSDDPIMKPLAVATQDI